MSTFALDRRSFLQALGGLVVGFTLPASSRADAPGDYKLNAFIHVGGNDTVTFFIHKAEMGQGTVTSLSMLLAEELGCDWKKIRTEFPGIDREFGPMQGVFGSQSIRTSWEPLRKAGATAREMLVQAGADKFGVAKDQCHAENGFVVRTGSTERMSFGSLAEAAAKLPKPSNVTLKDARNFQLIGTSPKRLDTPPKVDGSAKFGIDVRLPGMLYASLARCPVFGGKVAKFDAAQARAVAGVKDVFAISNGVAVVADNTWSAMEGQRALKIDWDEGTMAEVSSASIRKTWVELASRPGAVARKQGDAEAALAAEPGKKLEAVYEAPYLAHAPMEPLNCVAHVRADGCEVWASTQIQTAAAQIAAKVTGFPMDKVQVHTMFLGGGFGRRGGNDYIGEAVEIAKQAKVPVKLTWSREDDLRHDLYRPASYTTFRAVLDPEGWPLALSSRVVCPPFGGLRNGVDRTAVEGVADLPYAIPHLLVDYHAGTAGIPVSYWRSGGYSQNTFFSESFLDELAAAGGKDPLALRQRLLADSPRLLGALNLAAEKAGYGKPLPPGHFHGIAAVSNIGSFTAQIAEVSVTKGKLKVHRVVCAVDCGHVVNPAGVAQQIQSGIVYGLTAALKGSITIDRGRVMQQNFHNYDVLRIDEMPIVDVYTVASTAAPGGVGEASTPPVAPAVLNAVFAATGKRLRSLPIGAKDLA